MPPLPLEGDSRALDDSVERGALIELEGRKWEGAHVALVRSSEAAQIIS